MLSIDDISKYVIDVPDFPKEGIVFKDITPILLEPKVFSDLIAHFVESAKELEPTKLVAVESRGFLFGSAMAPLMNCPLVLARKPGKLPREVESQTYELEYGTDSLEIHRDAIDEGDKVVIVDDVLATGGTAQAVELLCKKLGAEVVGHRFLMEIEILKGFEKLSGSIHSFLKV